MTGALFEYCIYTYFCAASNNLVECSYLYESENCYECVACTKCYSSTYLIECNNSTDCHFSALLNSCTDCFGCVALSHKKYCIFNKQYKKDEYFKKLSELKKEKPEKILERMNELKKQIPHPASQQSNTENSPYGNYLYDSKNCFWSFSAFYSEDSGYIFVIASAIKCWDMFRSGGIPGTKTKSERCYELTESRCNYECAYLYNSENNTNCYHSADLTNCTDCFGCVGLKNKKYCILNNQLTKEQYEKAVKIIKKELGWKY